MDMLKGWHRPRFTFDPDWVRIGIVAVGLVIATAIFGWRGLLSYLLGAFVGGFDFMVTRFDGKLRVVDGGQAKPRRQF